MPRQPSVKPTLPSTTRARVLDPKNTPMTSTTSAAVKVTNKDQLSRAWSSQTLTPINEDTERVNHASRSASLGSKSRGRVDTPIFDPRAGNDPRSLSTTTKKQRIASYTPEQERLVESMMPDFIKDPKLRKGPKNQCTLAWMNEVQQIIDMHMSWHRSPSGLLLCSRFSDLSSGLHLENNVAVAKQEEKRKCPLPHDTYLRHELKDALEKLTLERNHMLFDQKSKAEEIDQAVQEALSRERKKKKRVSFRNRASEEELTSLAMSQRQQTIRNVLDKICDLEEEMEMYQNRLRTEMEDYSDRFRDELSEMKEDLLKLPIGMVAKTSSGEESKRSSFKEGSYVKAVKEDGFGGEAKTGRGKKLEKRRSRLSGFFHRG
ncbi:hypothetical protein E4T38_06199 [Aureobasidium subglaciale]|nr:hypothetical protein E4T38_06199 [Aureobasidium subglaciale]KAI5219900.1 hypothetical protein E4T40_06220 [Aureobasidium subglaciale]KAI5223682.1 hypothetical protein E4T41_05977 [Aureobasidium subglaciale]KAI5260560.1 hypothetical protein E4T46_05954 [Aureobasidium subglaciale]